MKIEQIKKCIHILLLHTAEHKRYRSPFVLMMTVVNFSQEIDPHLTYHIDPHTSGAERGTHRPRTSIPNRLPADVAEN